MPRVFRILEKIPQRKLLGEIIFKNCRVEVGGGVAMRQAGKRGDLNFCDQKVVMGCWL